MTRFRTWVAGDTPATQVVMRLLPALVLALALPLVAAKPFHLELEANPAAPFPFLGKFGTVTVNVYPSGVRAATFWLNGFSKNGSAVVTVENPLDRSYSDVKVTELGALVAKLAGKHDANANNVPTLLPPVAGSVKGIEARRYRLTYGPDAWIDVWTTTAIADVPQLRAICLELVRGVAPGTAAALRAIPGTPLYVELNFRRFRKLPLLRTKSLTWDANGEADALKPGLLYYKSPSLAW
jgi:hypothetical protein